MKHYIDLKYGGVSMDKAENVLIMLHGRGSTSEDILSISKRLNIPGYALIAPQAADRTWYPYSFMAPVEENEPWLTSAVDVVAQTVQMVVSNGVKAEKIYFLGFSQGACLTLEFTARNAQRYGGIVAFTGGLIGREIEPVNYKGDFKGTPVLMTTGDPDFHVPLERVNTSVEYFKSMSAKVTAKVYPNRPHTISADEIELANRLIFK
jgi:phospholipase/carboxylesterase